ncbi:MAG: LURP-one-related family protein [Lentilactobacillus buchneri]|nr:LURP-one-related family protein [Lentilactobacillus buchneri]MCI1950774.1 LURP-one-related family protein [Lentilactobacillus buchneri]MCI2019402.1 LURP-one-related family protein [Lentilactobacillus buchneri]MCI2028026.1 LURP-one-related family protein [Lentilactobacillus buchneri]
MTILYVKQKLFSMGGHFTVTDQQQHVVYTVQGSVMQLSKSFTINNCNNQEVAKVIQKLFSFLPTYEVEMNGKLVATIRKKLTLFRAKFEIDAGEIEVDGDMFGLKFSITKDGHEIATIHEAALSLGYYYEIDVKDDQFTHLVVAILLTIDYVKQQESRADMDSKTY